MKGKFVKKVTKGLYVKNVKDGLKRLIMLQVLSKKVTILKLDLISVSYAEVYGRRL